MSWSFGPIVTVLFAPKAPVKDNTLYPPSDKAPSVVVKSWVVPDKDIEPTPLIALSIISKLVLVVVPQVPDCSPDPGFSIPVFTVYVLAMFLSLCNSRT